MKTTDGFHYAYNAQTVVDEGSQVVLAAEVTQQAADIDQLFFMIGVTEGNLDAADIDDSPEVVLADAGYCSEANLQQIADAEINALVATGRIRGKERVSDAPRGRIPNERHPTRTDGPETPDQGRDGPTTPDARPSWSRPSAR